MAESQVFTLTSGEGYGAIVNGNFITVCIGFSSSFSASVSAFQLDGNHQYQSFDTLEEAVSWAVATAATHEGQAHSISKIEYWEVRNGYSITVERPDSGGYKADTFPMWVDSDNFPVMNNFKTFPAMDEAIEWARQSADEQSRSESAYQEQLQRIRDALAAQSR